jgi:hypothetical protein
MKPGRGDVKLSILINGEQLHHVRLPRVEWVLRFQMTGGLRRLTLRIAIDRRKARRLATKPDALLTNPIIVSLAVQSVVEVKMLLMRLVRSGPEYGGKVSTSRSPEGLHE